MNTLACFPNPCFGVQVGSTIIAQAAGVPTLPWSGSGVAVDYAACGGVIPVRCHLAYP